MTRPRVSTPVEVLLVEDKDSLRSMLRLALERGGHEVIEARDQPEAEQALLDRRPGLVLSDLRLPAGDGFGVLRAAKAADPDMPVVVMTAYGGVEEAVRAVREGALDFLAKPVDPDHLLLLIGRALEQRRLATENLLLKEELAVRRGAPHIVGEHESLRRVLTSVQRAAAAETTVLIEGESGTGKELIARTLHVLSPRADGPFVAINCAAIPETLLESELFGYEKGAFTGAATRKPGKFEVAHRGTLFLDEIGDLPLGLQAKVLRALEQKTFERLGGNVPLQVDVRVVAATNRNLRAAVAARRFREDLYFRLSVFPVTVPPLRERPADVPLLARHFVERFCRDQKKRDLTLSPAALDELMAYPWPGNVRELQNCLERAVILADGDTIHPAHLHLAFSGEAPAPAQPASAGTVDPWASIDLSGSLADATRRVLLEAERRKVAMALAQHGGDRAKAAEALQVPVRYLAAKMREHRLE
ncbi:MAG: sigma-54 dependent transcriptional regulator [Acidobacteria bacterium]|nr:sigma-54 dependent transcriptional regulator [Acidobacteriota bacterium]